jgi:hypothetical protein
MQVFVSKSALGLPDPIPVLGYYVDTPVLDRDLHGSGATVFSLPLSAVIAPSPMKPITGVTPPTTPAQPTDTQFVPVLKASWRADNMPQMVNDEALRRIEESFPDYMQRNANAAINASTMQYGVDTTAWPQPDKDRKTANDTGWIYVQAVRDRSDALESQITLTDPTDDSHWPTRIPPVYI